MTALPHPPPPAPGNSSSPPLRLIGAIILWSACGLMLLGLIMPWWYSDGDGTKSLFEVASGTDVLVTVLIAALAGLSVWAFVADLRAVTNGVVALSILISAQIGNYVGYGSKAGAYVTFAFSLAAVAGASLLTSHQKTGSNSHTGSGDSAPAAGWYTDPGDSTLLRYWSGTSWSEHTSNVG